MSDIFRQSMMSPLKRLLFEKKSGGSRGRSSKITELEKCQRALATLKKNEKVRAMGFQHVVEGINCLLREMESMPPASTVKDFENKISKTCLPTLAEMFLKAAVTL